MAQPVVAHRAVKPFDVGILLRISWLDIAQVILLFRPSLELFDVFRAIVTSDNGGLPRHVITCSSARLTREAGKEKSTRCTALHD